MQHPESLNALINPVSYGQEIIINGEVYTVGNCIRQGWTLVSGDTGDIVATGHSQVDFIAEVLKFNEAMNRPSLFNKRAPFPASAIDRIRERTDANDHTGALLELAMWVRDLDARNDLPRIMRLHDQIGHMPQSLIALRDSIRDQMLSRMQANGYRTADVNSIAAAL